MPQFQWLNEPDNWTLTDQRLRMFVTPKTDFWRKTHYGFTVDDGPFCYCQRSGEFDLTVTLTGHYRARFDQMGLMLRIDAQNWIKTGIEYVDGIHNLSAVVTRETSDWSMIPLVQPPPSVNIKISRRLDAVEIFYVPDGQEPQLIRLAPFPAHRTVLVGMTAASPDGDGFEAIFDDFSIRHVPDTRRLQWLKNNDS